MPTAACAFASAPTDRAPTSGCPLVGAFTKHGTDQADDYLAVGEDAHRFATPWSSRFRHSCRLLDQILRHTACMTIVSAWLSTGTP